MRLLIVVCVVLCFALVAVAAGAPAEKGVALFEKKGMLVDVQKFFDAAKDAPRPEGAVAADGASGLALVTDEGVYAFLETPSNADLLKPLPAGTLVAVTGKLLKQGRLLHIEKIEAVKEAAGLDVAKAARDPGQAVTLAGRNLCQCGLAVESLPKTCKLGHLHHLQTADGVIYHYLQTQTAQRLFLGKGSHFKNIEVKAKVLPGQYLLVESFEVKPAP